MSELKNAGLCMVWKPEQGQGKGGSTRQQRDQDCDEKTSKTPYKLGQESFDNLKIFMCHIYSAEKL